ncbi:hypothetical protein KTE64_18850 [Burkholderia multivorans]|uniref:hypothetical protein n=2 Tax=Burkholderia multivorans TaxID=87883 RepID=UPI001C239368|nr:hypothetical protein [Burkholderia multivorans]MBU9514465.1 hypothetical protein [Burkholderia multivorans]MDN8009185.1 hypothetical protein [Burkholderia multivorans]
MRPMTARQRAYIDLCIASAKYEIVSLMSMSLLSFDAHCLNDFRKDGILDRYAFCEDRVERGRELFPDAPGQPEGSGFDGVYDDIICTALDEWLSGPVMPFDEVGFPPDPAFDDDLKPYPDQ